MVKKLLKPLNLIALFVTCLFLNAAYADQPALNEKDDSPIYIFDYLKDFSVPKETNFPYSIPSPKETDLEPTASPAPYPYTSEENKADKKTYYLELQILAHSTDGGFGTPTLVGLGYQNLDGGFLVGARKLSGSYRDSSSAGVVGSTSKGKLTHQELELGYSFLTASAGRITPLVQYANGDENFSNTKYSLFNPPVRSDKIRSYDAIQAGLRYYFPSRNPEAGAYISFVLTSRDYSDGNSNKSSYLDIVGYSGIHNLIMSFKFGGENNSNYMGIGLFF